MNDSHGEAPRRVFKTDGNFLYTKQLFYEQADVERQYVLYTLKDEDHQGYPSIKRLYLEMEDETEYLFATTYFASWNHFKKICATPWFKPVIQEAREELRLKLAARNLAKIREKAKEGHVQANQYLLERKWDSAGPGRPSKKKIQEEASRLVEDKSFISEDYDRLVEQMQASGVKV